MSRIFWDSNLFIYLFENNPQYAQRVEDLYKKMLSRRDQLLTSTLTVGEVLVKPTAMGDDSLCRNYERILNRTAQVIPFDANVARRYATVRTTTSIKGPDAVQLACASHAGVDLFITNDNHLKGRHVEGIQFIVALDQVPL
ncbi:MAG TPA: PIN domain-containing protein [Candidatus Sulfotelmatobacter sp.]|jgi:predicted nucleic acid-binding protein